MLTDEQLGLLKARDARVRALDTSLLVAQELDTSKTLQLVLAALAEDVDEAIEEFADVNPADTLAVSALQARVHRLIYIRRTLKFIHAAGAAASAALQAEDVIEQGD